MHRIYILSLACMICGFGRKIINNVVEITCKMFTFCHVDKNQLSLLPHDPVEFRKDGKPFDPLPWIEFSETKVKG